MTDDGALKLLKHSVQLERQFGQYEDRVNINIVECQCQQKLQLGRFEYGKATERRRVTAREACRLCAWTAWRVANEGYGSQMVHAPKGKI